MAIIDQYRSILTLVLEWETTPKEALKHAASLKEHYQIVAKNLPGYISTNLHISLDQTKIVNYEQWKSEEDFNNFLKESEGHELFKALPKVIKMKVSYAS